jgi:hypothetical protein
MGGEARARREAMARGEPDSGIRGQKNMPRNPRRTLVSIALACVAWGFAVRTMTEANS